MAQLSRSLTVETPLALVAEYLSDLTTTLEWDPHTVACRRVGDGPVSVGAQYEHTRDFNGYRATVPTQVVEFDPGSRVVWEGGSNLAHGREEFVFQPSADGGTTLTHTVEVTLLGVARFGNAMLPMVMKRIADDGTDQLLGRLRQLS